MKARLCLLLPSCTPSAYAQRFLVVVSLLHAYQMEVCVESGARLRRCLLRACLRHSPTQIESGVNMARHAFHAVPSSVQSLLLPLHSLVRISAALTG